MKYNGLFLKYVWSNKVINCYQKSIVLFQIMPLVLQASGNVIEVDDLRKGMAYLILHIHIAQFTKQIILKLEDGSKREKENLFVYLPVSHRSGNRPFSNPLIFNINSKQEYFKLLFLILRLLFKFNVTRSNSSVKSRICLLLRWDI